MVKSNFSFGSRGGQKWKYPLNAHTPLPKLRLQGPQCSDAGEARTLDPSVLSQALYHWATALPKKNSA